MIIIVITNQINNNNKQNWGLEAGEMKEKNQSEWCPVERFVRSLAGRRVLKRPSGVAAWSLQDKEITKHKCGCHCRLMKTLP